MYTNQPPAVPNFDEFMKLVHRELAASLQKYPDSVGSDRVLAYSLESAEMLSAVNSEPWANVVKEAAQVCAMAFRLATEGDAGLVEHRVKRGAGPSPLLASMSTNRYRPAPMKATPGGLFNAPAPAADLTTAADADPQDRPEPTLRPITSDKLPCPPNCIHTGPGHGHHGHE